MPIRTTLMGLGGSVELNGSGLALTADGHPDWDPTFLKLYSGSGADQVAVGLRQVTLLGLGGFVAGAAVAGAVVSTKDYSVPTKAALTLGGGLVGYCVAKIVESFIFSQ